MKRKETTRLVVDRDKPMNLYLELRFIKSWDFFYELGITQGYQLDHLLLSF